MFFGSGAGKPTDLVGEIIDSAEIFLYRYPDSPGDVSAAAVLHDTGLTDVPVSGAHSPHGSALGAGSSIGNWAKDTGKWVTLPVALAQAIIAGRCIALFSGNSNLGRWYGIEGGANKPQVRITHHAPVPAPTTPNTVYAPGTITDDTFRFDWTSSHDDSGYFAVADLSYEMQISLDGGATWGVEVHPTSPGVHEHSENLRTYLGLAVGQYYLNTNCKFQVRSVTPKWPDGTGTEYRSGWAQSAIFAIDFRIAPSAPSSLTPSDATPYEGEAVTFTVGLPASHNDKDSAGLNEGIHYYVQLGSGLALKDVDTDVSFASKVTAAYTVGDMTTGLADFLTTIRANAVTHKNGNGALEQQTGPYLAGVAITIKRFRAPSVIITGIERASATAKVKIRITDTGYGGTQLGSHITPGGGIAYDLTPVGGSVIHGTAVLGAWPVSGNIDNEFTIDSLDPAKRYDLVIRPTNAPPAGTALTGKTGADYPATILEYMPGFFTWRDSAATGDQAPTGAATQALVVGDNFDELVNKGCVKVQNDLDVSGSLRKGGKDVLLSEGGGSKGVRRIILQVAGNSGNGTPTYYEGQSYVASVASDAQGLAINLQNIPVGAVLDVSFNIVSSGGINNTEPFMYIRSLTTSGLVIGIKGSPSGSAIPWNTVSAGTLRINIVW